MFNLDLDSIEEFSGGIQAGTHVLTVTKAELKETKAKTGMYIKVEFTNENNQKHWENYNIQNPNEMAQKIGLSQLKSFLKAAKFSGTKLNDVNAMLGLKVEAKIKVTDDPKWGEQKSITGYKPVSGAAEIKGQDPFV